MFHAVAVPALALLVGFAAVPAAAAAGSPALADAVATPDAADAPEPAGTATETSPPDPRAGAIGLLPLPEVYGTEPCQRFRPAPVPVYPEPGAGLARGEIRTAQHWTYPENGGCEGLRVEYAPAAGEPRELPAREYAYEQPAAIVLERRDDWYRIRLPDGDGWVRASPRDEFGPLPGLLQRDLATFTDPAGATLRRAPADDAEVAWSGRPECLVPRVRAADTGGPRPWIEVEFERDTCCADDAAATPSEPVRGWLPLYRDDGVPSVWFAPRGC